MMRLKSRNYDLNQNYDLRSWNYDFLFQNYDLSHNFDFPEHDFFFLLCGGNEIWDADMMSYIFISIYVRYTCVKNNIS